MPRTKKTETNHKAQNTPLVLIILDGWGIAPPSKSNAISLAKTPVMDRLWKEYPHTLLKASGQYVGLPPKQNGNSEAGHLNLGAGRIVDQDSVIISKCIKDGTFFKNPAFLEAIGHVQRRKSQLHLLGILSDDQCPHASPDHLEALLQLGKIQKIRPVLLHLFTDGRDSARYAAIKLIRKLEKKLKNQERIATILGRYYLDRTKNWEITEQAYNSLVVGEGRRTGSPNKAILQAYNRGETDEFISPTKITSDHKPIGSINNKDSVIFFNLRSDRARQLTKPFVQGDFNAKNSGAFRRKKVLKDIKFVAMTDFGPDLEGVLTAYPSIDVKDSLAMTLQNLRQIYIAEAQKYAHMTYFFNGGYANPVGGEERITVPSIPVKHFEEEPKMSADIITATVLKKLKEKKYDFLALNFANPDMVGHTGNVQSTIVALEFVDSCLKKIISEVLKQKGTVVITADHGNAEEMINLVTGEVDTKHSSSEVPLIIVSNNRLTNKKQLPEGVLGNVAPTILDILRIEKPKLMKCESLL
ncbi:MAG: 2,3-bisphosphoglycerate-independent phosphoglycerate mutase [Candidatus Kerfeldbacteria bacterium CG_4_10_14_0_8_um_filter_42_10]|uniref:2,3-bisphosphoglycerate-independent phosphoglycerate mutase n=1 Tax=Candidatus Kerfeldbacteria bacterium CG_4_10_14_0_8_um_filter_42_10 TaxID=2014248 RepID=A0A2M7RGK9_9BACT|nr:MAG: 2,3-bisphosphoglycerate-independent phosphoglycerate mutase [Candidatus Kerfeldbacteria bacterium CG_4_10_14_0_8_um_filter_42_10]